MSDRSEPQSDPQSDHLAQLLAIVNEEQEVEDLTEEELHQALDSPTLNTVDGDEESTECDEYENSDGMRADNDLNAQTADQSGDGPTVEPTLERTDRRNEYQFQMLDHHIFKGKHGKKLYKCDVCYAVYRHSFSLKRHFIRSHINYGYLCETDVTNCGINLSASASLQTWTEQRSGDSLNDADMPELYCCHSCVLFFDDLPQIKSHVDDCHRNNKSGTIEPIRIPCSQCNMSFIQRHNLMRHIEVVHQGRKLYACKHCGKKFQTISDRKKHEKSQHQSSEQLGQAMPSKTHACIRCSQIFYTYSNLRKHVNKKHNDCYNPCGFCTKFAFNKKELTEHLRTRHGKTIKENKEKLKIKKELPINCEVRVGEQSTIINNTLIATNMSLQQQMQSAQQAYFHCSLCFRRFLTYSSLIKHKQFSHRPHVRNCSRLTAQTPPDNEIISPFNNSNEIEFYRTLAQRVAENLLYFVDGKFVNCRKSDEESIPLVNKCLNESDLTRLELNLNEYNFPADYSCSSPPSSNSEKLEFLHDCNLHTTPMNSMEVISSSIEERSLSPSSSSKTQFICSACNEKISPETFADHEANNHPNVYCTYIEVDSCRSIPSQLLLWHYHKPDGLLHRCPVAPSLPKTNEIDSHISLRCTKCTKSFSSVNLLHHHILECAHNSSKKKSNTNHNTNNNINHKSNNDSNISINNLFSTNTDKSSDYLPPLSPCKTRSGKRRQITPDRRKASKRSKSSSIAKVCDTKLKQQKQAVKQNELISVNSFKDIIVSSTQVIDDNNNNQRIEDSKNKTEIESEIFKDDQNLTIKNFEKVPKRYLCKKCNKRFVYMDALKKHQLSCKLVVYKSNQTSQKDRKVKLKSRNKKLALKIDLKAIKSILQQKNDKKKIGKKKAPNISKSLYYQRKYVTRISSKQESPKKVEDEGNFEESKRNSKANLSENLSVSNWTPKSLNISTSSTDVSEKRQSLKSNSSATDIEVNESNTPVSSTNGSSLSSLHEHRCPDCLRIFTYMANFRKHIKNVCPVRRQLGHDNNTTIQPITTPLIQKLSSEQTSPNSSLDLVIKQEIQEVDELKADAITNNSETSIEDEVIYEGETPVEKQTEDEDDVCLISKEDSKLDLWRVKQENPMYAFKGSPAQHHSCPYCQRGFTYLANYRKHIKSICPIRQQIEEKKKQVMEDSQDSVGNANFKIKNELTVPTLVYTPTSLSVRSQIEDTVLTLLRDQTKQDQILQSSEEMMKSNSSEIGAPVSTIELNELNADKTELSSLIETNCDLKANNNNNNDDEMSKEKKKEVSSSGAALPAKGSYRFRTFSCNICHKIFLSYVTMLKHRLSHKLSEGTINEENNGTTNSMNANNSTTASVSSNQLLNVSLIEANHDKEAQNQELAASLLKKSKEAILCKMRNNVTNSMKVNSNKTINTTELLEKLARGGISTESLASNNTKIKAIKEKTQLLLSENSINNNNNNDNDNHASCDGLPLNVSLSSSNVQEIIIEANNLTNLTELQQLSDLQQLIVDNEEDSSKVAVDKVLLDIDPNDIGSANELWITFTDSSAFVEVPETATNATVDHPITQSSLNE